ncbi:M48 family metallopeptidase [Terrisporobacter petrolearius]|uniref:M48 family metallopeptidase n=1 Tax=Terrisporobacter petrolearius TaxID=1460447 RepID=UPI0031CCCD99
MDIKYFRHYDEEYAFNELKKVLSFNEELESLCVNIEEKLKYPDLLGKTVRASENQFTQIYRILERQAQLANIEVPDLFIYEEFHYGVQSKGTTKPWIEISAKTVQDFSDDEIEFLIAREIYNIKNKVTYYNGIFEELLKILSNGSFLIGVDTLIDTIKIKMYQWSRLTNYSADNYGYLNSKNIKVCIHSILSLVLNSVYLSKNVYIASYIKEAQKINELDGIVYDYTKLDEMVPYAPHRIKNIISYASSDRGMKAINLR